MEQSLSDTQHRLSVKSNELHAAHEQIEKLEDRIGEYCILEFWGLLQLVLYFLLRLLDCLLDFFVFVSQGS